MSHDPADHIRAATADRERTIDVLRAAYAEGRISDEELRQRTDEVWASRTLGELRALVRDLPAGPFPAGVPTGPTPPMPYGHQLAPYPRFPYLPSRARTNGTAIASLACGVLGFLFLLPSVPAIALGHAALRQLPRTGEDGRGMAVAGIALGWTVLGFATLWILLFLLIP